MNNSTNDERLKRAVKISDIVVSVLAITLGIAFIASAAHIYYTGGSDPYTRERVGEYLSYLLIPTVIFILSVIVSAILSTKAYKSDKIPPHTDAEYRLIRTKKRTPTYKLAEGVRKTAELEQRKRLVYKCSAAIVTLIAIVVAAIFTLDSTQYKNEQLTSEIVGAFSVILPLVLISFATLTTFSYLSLKSAERELTARAGAKAQADAEECEFKLSVIGKVRDFLTKNEAVILVAVKIAVAILAAVLVIYGISGGGMADVLSKAVKICTECIGLG